MSDEDKNLSLGLDFLRPVAHGIPGAESAIVSGAGITANNELFLSAENARRFADGMRAAGLSRAGQELALGVNNQLPVNFLAIGARRARAVCRVATSGTNYRGQLGRWHGTGFLVSPNVLLTNHHVLNSTAVADAAVARFGYELDESGKPGAVEEFRLNPARLFVTHALGDGLDFTFVWVDGEPGKTYGHFVLERRSFNVADRDNVNVIHHPSGRMKEVTLQDNNVRRQDAVVVRYTTDTEPGSSGSPILNNRWELVALHHASVADSDGENTPDGDGPYLNEGIKLSAIAVMLEQLRDDPTQGASARDVLELIRGVDEAAGFFGSLGRARKEGAGGYETVVNAYRGEADDLDVGFWNVEWFNRTWREKLSAVASVVAQLNLDIWAFEETSAEATGALVNELSTRFGLDFDVAASEPAAANSKQATAVIWNKKTVRGAKKEWPQEIDSWLRDNSSSPQLGPAPEAVHGKIFDRYPAWYQFRARRRDGSEFVLNLVPLHLKAMEEGSLRRRLAAKYLAAIVATMIETHGASEDWILGGDFNAPLAQGDFEPLADRGLVAISQDDEDGGAITYVKSPKSLIDHIFVSKNLARTVGAKDYFIVALDRTIDQYTRGLSDHRPVLARLSTGGATRESPTEAMTEVPAWLAKALASPKA